MKTLEKLDGVSIAADLKAARQYRKTMVKVSLIIEDEDTLTANQGYPGANGPC